VARKETKLPDGRLETDFRNEVILKASETGRVVVWPQNAGIAVTKNDHAIALGPTGISDIIGVARGGKFVAFEVKSPTRATTSEQKNFLKIVKTMGGVALLYRYDTRLDWDQNAVAARDALLAAIAAAEATK